MSEILLGECKLWTWKLSPTIRNNQVDEGENFISFHFSFLLYNNQWLMNTCGDIIATEMTAGILLEDERQFLKRTRQWIFSVLCIPRKNYWYQQKPFLSATDPKQTLLLFSFLKYTTCVFTWYFLQFLWHANRTWHGNEANTNWLLSPSRGRLYKFMVANLG